MHGKCDLCVALAVHLQVPISIDGSKPKTLDLCKRHYAKLIQPVLDALATYGGNPPKPAKKQANYRQGWLRKIGPFKCRLGCAMPPLKNGTTLETHLRLVHDMTLTEYVAQYGELRAATPEELKEVVEVWCEVKGCDQVYSTDLGNRWPQQAMISHMRGRHGLNWRPGKGVIGKVG